MSERLIAQSEQLVKMAQTKGATMADAFAVRAESVSAGVRLGVPEAIERSEDMGVGLRVFVGQSYASVSTADFNENAVDTLVSQAIEMAKAAPEDPYAGLAKLDRVGVTSENLELADASEISIEQLQDAAKNCEETGRAHSGITNSEGAYAGFSRYEAGFYASSGASFTHVGTQHSLSLSLIAGEGEDMQRDYAYATTRFLSDLDSPEAIANDAAQRTLSRMNPKKIPSETIAVIFDPRVGRGLLGSFSGAINGSAIARGTSFLKDQMGEKIFSDTINIVDDPFLVRGLASEACDDEGVKGAKRNMVENGVLQSWFLDTSTANQLGLETTGHASRSLGGSPSPSSTNLYIAPGAGSVEDLCAGFDRAFYVTETFGHGVNLVTGDYSQGASGFLLEKGERVHPVSEVTIAGNLKDMFLQLQAANDLVMRYSTNVPTLAIRAMTVAGA